MHLGTNLFHGIFLVSVHYFDLENMSFKPQAFQQPQFRAMATSISQLAKRAFLTILLALARQYGVDTGVGRDSEDSLLDAAFRKVIRRVALPKVGHSRTVMPQVISSFSL